MKQRLKQPVSPKSIVKRAIPAAALIALGLSWPNLLSGKQAFVETTYSEGVYQPIRRAIASVTSCVPFSIAEFILYALVLFTAVLLITRIVQMFLRKRGYLLLLKSISALLLTAGIILNLFYVTWGFNYFRQPLSERMGLNITERSVDELETFVRNTAQQAATLRETLNEDGNGVFMPQGSRQQIFNELPQAYVALSGRFPIFSGHATRAKFVLWSRGLSWQGISGVFIGLTAEPNVNVDQPPLLLYQAATHEMAHQTGIAAENEADFTAYLACMSSNDPNVQYSGLIYALIVSGNALYETDAARYIAAADVYGSAIWRDLQDYDAYWDAFDGALQESADKRNDVYLKHNAQQSGVESYGEAVDLLLAFAEAYGE